MTSGRLDALVGALAHDLDGILVTKLVNVRYLSGFSGSNGAVLVSREGDVVLATDGRYAEQAKAESPGLQLRITRTLGPELVKLAAASGLQRLAFERDHVTVGLHDALVAAAGDLELVGVEGLVERLRMRKDDAELRALRAACEITDRAFEDACSRLAPGVTERQVAWWLLDAMHAHGAEGAAFDSIVAFGSHAAIPHHQPTDRALGKGDLVKLDFGARVEGYHSDMTRTVVCGTPADWQRDLHALVLDIQQRCRDAAVAGALPAQLDDLARDAVEASGHQPAHGLGHGVGLEIHEQPLLVPGTQSPELAARVPVTIEPGIYLPGRGGVRIEDTVLVTDEGPQPLTRATRELLQI